MVGTCSFKSHRLDFGPRWSIIRFSLFSSTPFTFNKFLFRGYCSYLGFSLVNPGASEATSFASDQVMVYGRDHPGIRTWDQWIFEVLILRSIAIWNCLKRTHLSAGISIWLICGKYLMSQQLLYFGHFFSTCHNPFFFLPAWGDKLDELAEEIRQQGGWHISSGGLSRLNIVSFCIRIPQQTFCSELIEPPLNLWNC